MSIRVFYKFLIESFISLLNYNNFYITLIIYTFFVCIKMGPALALQKRARCYVASEVRLLSPPLPAPKLPHCEDFCNLYMQNLGLILVQERHIHPDMYKDV